MAKPKTQPVMTRSVSRAAEIRQQISQVLELPGDLTVRVKRIDMVTMLFEGLMPMPLLQAIQKLMGKEKVSDSDRAVTFLSMPDEERESLLNMLRRFAVKAVTDPQLVLEDDGVDDHLPVDFLSFDQLLKIFQACGPRSDKALATEADADRFRGEATAVPGDASPDGEGVREKPVVVDRPHIEFEHA